VNDRPATATGSRSSPELAILVNTSDGFQDCWEPFFTLLERYWPDRRFSVYLNTETVGFQHPRIAVTNLTHPPGPDGRRPPWSDRLIASLAAIPERNVLYMQEDYFLDAPVRSDIIDDCLQVVDESAAGCVHLTSFGSRLGRSVAERSYLVDVPRFSHYRVSTQAAIWDKRLLASYLRSGETVWETEILGTVRAWNRMAGIRAIDPRRLADGPVVSYTGTGIIRGRWHPAMVPLFTGHGITVDFSVRGFHDFPSRWHTRSRILWGLLSRPHRPLAALLGL